MRGALLLLLLSVPLLAQTPFQEKVTISYVEVPVTVVGRDGTPLRGLTKDNFELLDGGQKRVIESFEAIDFASAEGARGVSPLNPASRRNFLLLFDLSFSSPQSVLRAQVAARAFVARSVHRRDLVAIGSIDIDRGFRFLTAFTTDRELLVAAIADPGKFRTRDPLQIAASSPYADLPSGPDGRVPDQRAGEYAENVADLARAGKRLDDAYNRGRALKQVEMLGHVAASLRKLAGRKHLVLLSDGFDPRLISGRSAGETSEQLEENRAIEFGEIWKVDSDKRFGNAPSQKSVTDMADQFRRSDVVLHAVDIKGVRVQNTVRDGANLSSNEALFLLASSTGGTVFRNSNDITGEFDKLSRQHEVVYVLGFRGPAGRAGQFHELRVKLVNVPNARAQHRGGYYEQGVENVVERSLSMAEVIVNDIPQDTIGVRALASAFPMNDGRAQVPVILEIDGDDLLAQAQKNVATTDIFVYGFDEEGIVRDSIYQRVTLDVAKAGAQLKDNGIRFYTTLHLPAGHYAVKSLVRVIESDAKGYQRVSVDVAEDGDVSVVPVFMAPADSWVMVRGDDHAKAPYPFVLEGESFIPAVRATLRKGEPRLFAVFVHNAEADELTWEFAPEATLVSQKGGQYVFALERVPPETRELRITVRKKGATDTRQATVPIEVK